MCKDHNISSEAVITTLSEDVVIGSRLSPPWNNEACSVCQDNHACGRVVTKCPVLYNGQCLVEQINLKINEKGEFFRLPSFAFDFITTNFPELKMTNNAGTTKVYIHKFERWFYFYKNYTGQYYIRL